MARLPETHLSDLPRLADFATWVSAAEASLGWADGAFLEAYNRNRASANHLALDASAVAPLIRQLAKVGWRGTATELHTLLDSLVDEVTRRQPHWPKNARAVSNVLRRLLPNLRKTGIQIESEREGTLDRRRLITISSIPAPPVENSLHVLMPPCLEPQGQTSAAA
jgi:hypothetical protein